MLSQCKRLVWINNNLRKRTNAIRCVNIKVTVLAQYFFLAKHPSRFRKLLLTPISLKLIRSFKGDSSSYSTPSVSALSVSLRGWGKKSWESEVKGEPRCEGKKRELSFSLSLSPNAHPFYLISKSWNAVDSLPLHRTPTPFDACHAGYPAVRWKSLTNSRFRTRDTSIRTRLKSSASIFR